MYTALEVTTAVLAALYQRERDGRGQWIDVSMAETMLYVNEHLNDQLWDGAVDPQDDPQLRPGRLPRVRGRRRRQRHRQRAPGRAGHVRAVPAGLRRGAPRRRPSLRRRRRPSGQRRRAAVGAARRRRARSPTRRRSRSSSAPTSSPSACCAAPATSPSRTGPRSVGRSPRSPTVAAARSASPTRRGTSATPRSACAARRSYRGEDNRAVARRAARLRRRDHRRLRGRRGAVQPVAIIEVVTLSFPVAPMKATLGTLPTEDDGWAYEVKWDGYRTLAFVDGGRGAAAELEPASTSPPSTRRCRRWPGRSAVRRAVLDGELVVLDDAGPAAVRADPAPRDRQAGGRVLRVRRAVDRRPRHRSRCPTRTAAGCSASVLETGPNWAVPAHRIGDGQALARRHRGAGAGGRDGQAARDDLPARAPARRTGARSSTAARPRSSSAGTRRAPATGRGAFGALLVGRWVDGRLAFAGGVGTGFTQRRLEELGRRFAELETEECPFDPPPPTAYRRGAVWLEPVLRAKVELTEFTNEGYVRQASFIDLVE